MSSRDCPVSSAAPSLPFSMIHSADQPDKILIIHSGGIGDLLLALPAMRIFRGAFPHSILELLGRPERLTLLSQDLQASSIRSIDQGGMAYFYLERASLPSDLVTYFSSFRAALIFGRSGAEILAGNLRMIGVSRVILIPSFPPEGGRAPVSDYLVESLRNEGLAGRESSGSLALSQTSQDFAADFRALHGLKEGEQVLAIHPGSGSPEKNWKPANFACVADWAGERSRILLIAGPADKEIEEVKKGMKKARPVIADQLPLPHLAGVLKSCTAYLGNDSGITHLAAVLEIPAIAIFGPTDPSVWGPRGSRTKVIYDKNSCSPCPPEMRSPCNLQCLESIKPDAVIEILEAILGTSPTLSSPGQVSI